MSYLICSLRWWPVANASKQTVTCLTSATVRPAPLLHVFFSQKLATTNENTDVILSQRCSTIGSRPSLEKGTSCQQNNHFGPESFLKWLIHNHNNVLREDAFVLYFSTSCVDLILKKKKKWVFNMKCVIVTFKDWLVESSLLSGSFVLRVCFCNEFDWLGLKSNHLPP